MPRSPAWKNLVAALEGTGFESPYLDRLRARVTPEAAHQALEQEIIAEMANALGRAEDKVDAALLRLDLAARAIEQAPDPDARRARITRFNQLREEALRVRRDLLIHREALGFYRNEHLEDVYPIPPRRSLD